MKTQPTLIASRSRYLVPVKAVVIGPALVVAWSHSSSPITWPPVRHSPGPFCCFLTLFCSVRLFAGTCVFDLRHYLTNRWRRTELAVANLVFACLPLVCAWVALKGVE